MFCGNGDLVSECSDCLNDYDADGMARCNSITCEFDEYSQACVQSGEYGVLNFVSTKTFLTCNANWILHSY